MKRIKAILLVAVMMVGVTAFAQNGRRNSPRELCLNVPGLTQEQKTSVEKINANYRSEMDKLRTQRQSATTTQEKDNVGKKMDQLRDKHQKDVLAQLNPEQQKALKDSGFGQTRCQKNRKGRGRGNGRCCGNGGGRGYRNCGR